MLELVAREGGGMWGYYEQQAGGAVQSPAVRFVLPMSFCSLSMFSSCPLVWDLTPAWLVPGTVGVPLPAQGQGGWRREGNRSLAQRFSLLLSL